MMVGKKIIRVRRRAYRKDRKLWINLNKKVSRKVKRLRNRAE